MSVQSLLAPHSHSAADRTGLHSPSKMWDSQGAPEHPQDQTSGWSPYTAWQVTSQVTFHNPVASPGSTLQHPRPCLPSELHDKPLLPCILSRLQDPLRPTCQLVPTRNVLAHSLQLIFLQRYPACSMPANVSTTQRQHRQGS